MKVIKKQLALLISLILLAFPVSGMTAPAIFPSFSGGSGTEADPYLISDADGLYELAALVNSGVGCDGVYFLLTDDIALPDGTGWTPIGSGAQAPEGGYIAFKGDFNGGGHTVTGMSFVSALSVPASGFFGRTEGGSVHDINVSGVVGVPSGCTGGVIGVSLGTQLTDISFTGSVYGVSGVGGIVGRLSGGSITNCSFDGTLSGELSTGGVFGSGENALVSNCTASCTVSGYQYTGCIGGIADSVTFTRCASSGSLAAYSLSGGTVGFCFNCTLTECVNEAYIEGVDRIAGIAGNVQTSDFVSCVNNGVISAERFTGGVAGFCCGCTLTGCSNTGAVSGDDYIGGVMGWSDDGSDFGDNGLDNYISLCMNTGAVSGDWGVGGIIGDAHDAYVNDCFNTGDVSSVEYAGGLVGYTSESEVRRCYNVGTVRAGSNYGAVVGHVSNSGTVFENCFFLNTCCPYGDHGVSRSDTELLSEAAYTGFDFESTWSIPDTGYPYARLNVLLPPLPLYGDADGDGSITTVDALFILRYSMDIVPMTSLELFRSDIDADGVVDTTDALLTLRKAVNMRD